MYPGKKDLFINGRYSNLIVQKKNEKFSENSNMNGFLFYFTLFYIYWIFNRLSHTTKLFNSIKYIPEAEKKSLRIILKFRSN